jgi:rubrerythrin
MTIRSWQLVLARRMAAALLAAPALASQTSACAPPSPCPGGPDTTTRITFTLCTSLDAGATEASTDAASSDAGSTTCYATCADACRSMVPSNGGTINCTALTQVGDRVTTDCIYSFNCVGGRLTAGLARPELSGDVLGSFFAECAWLEAASIRSFERLARELADHGAPDDLVGAARAAAKDEARHARALARLAEKYGAETPRVVHRDCTTRSLEAIAMENATEGCVGETYGALIAYWQAEHASDPEVREAMRAIAPDELSHAALAWAIADWAETRLDAAAALRVRSARPSAANELVGDADVNPRLMDVAGIPPSSVTRALVDAMFAVWANGWPQETPLVRSPAV